MTWLQDWLQAWFETAKQVVFAPTQFFSDLEPEDDVLPLLAFSVTSLLVAGVLRSLVIIADTMRLQRPLQEATAEVVSVIGGALLSGVIGVFIIAAFYHVFVHLFGGRGYMKTVNIAVYVTAIMAFVGWIPGISSFGSLYGLYIWIRGLENLHDFSTGNAVLVMILPPVILVSVALIVLRLIV